ncbi:hypothetical protein CLV62_13014 [Dysgonomonas alginatilytica]|uniref:Uncharacterized protein n=1 Tax=Dysgonomonas alginatilytica TaxID=1605892 RepID=A0A2V3PLD2_9BACT|nr:hypothetical protein [Dysgonomonas alginatilytica]PXV60166.1 hypothetical protein CLV62_13014 [Dysgonomonas alginatilytica]
MQNSKSMDISKYIEEQINNLKDIESSTYLVSILIHLQRAEAYYIQGKDDAHYFNDVVYRSNQAYEGALKESFKILAGKTEDEVAKSTPNEIEKYFSSNNIFRERVLQLFKNYRQEWRNKSTHDYKLLFDESEAFIALTSVSSFVHLLLKQIQEKVAYIIQQQVLRKQENSLLLHLNSMVLSSEISQLDKLTNIIKEFVLQNYEQIYSEKINEISIIGKLYAFLESIDNIIIQREPAISFGSSKIRPDFIIEIDGKKIIIEIKRGNNIQVYTKNIQ